MDIEKLLIKIEQAKEKLDKYEIMLDKITPHKPSVYKHMDWNDKTRQMDKSYEYCCWYCGEQLRKGTKKHKCGYLVDWNFKEDELC